MYTTIVRDVARQQLTEDVRHNKELEQGEHGDREGGRVPVHQRQ